VGTDMICNMIRPEGTSRSIGTAIQTKPGKDMAPLTAASAQDAAAPPTGVRRACSHIVRRGPDF